MGMVPMDKETGKFYSIADWPNYIRIAKNKINIGPKEIGDAFLKFGDDGLLHHAEPIAERNQAMQMHLLNLLREADDLYSKNELVRETKGRPIFDQMKEQFPKFKRRTDMAMTVEVLLHDGFLVEQESEATGKGMPKKILRVMGQNNGN
jgi:hypothetical protein